MLKNSELRIIDNSKGGDQGIYVKELYETNKEDLKNSKSKIAILESEVKKMSKFNREALLFENVTKEAAVNYENLRRITFSNELISNLKSIDTLPVFRVTWKDGLDAKQSEAETKKLQKWLQLKFGNNKIVVKEQ
ncbi:hypothetical protein QIU18_01800 [Capnocytophaga canimorsus]|nr:hypothetical protein [Capnocytophaga canimorsus]WGU70843.1 hypothetical protein QIU18_01800 [Capnocytophaga canimorsus]